MHVLDAPVAWPCSMCFYCDAISCVYVVVCPSKFRLRLGRPYRTPAKMGRWIWSNTNQCRLNVWGHPFMTSTKNPVLTPLSTCVHLGRTPLPPCGRPHAVDMKYTRSLETASTMTYRTQS